MMRQIKFRAWDIESKRMLKIKSLHFTSKTGVFSIVTEPMTFISSEHLKLMQYTGLKDVNGVEIYEGDIVKIKDWKYGNEFLGEISFKNGSYVVESKIATHYRFIDYEIQVIGNIYENPELLED